MAYLLKCKFNLCMLDKRAFVSFTVFSSNFTVFQIKLSGLPSMIELSNLLQIRPNVCMCFCCCCCCCRRRNLQISSPGIKVITGWQEVSLCITKYPILIQCNLKAGASLISKVFNAFKGVFDLNVAVLV